MSKSNLIRWGGLAAMLGGLMWTGSWLLNAQTLEGNRAFLGLTEGNYRAMLNPALLGMLFGLVGMYALHAERFGKLGKIGFATSFLGLAMGLVGNLVEFGLIGEVTRSIGWFIMFPMFFVWPFGMLLFGLAALSAKGLPRWSSALPLVIGVVLVLAIFLGIAEVLTCRCGRADRMLDLLFLTTGFGWVALGYLLWSGKGETARQPEPET